MQHSRKSTVLSQIDYFSPLPKWGTTVIKFQMDKSGKVITVCISKKHNEDVYELEIEGNEDLSIRPFNKKRIYIGIG